SQPGRVSIQAPRSSGVRRTPVRSPRTVSPAAKRDACWWCIPASVTHLRTCIRLPESARSPVPGSGWIGPAMPTEAASGPRPTEGETMSKARKGTADREPSALPDADSHDVIRVHGARENNLKDVSIEIPKRRLTVFTGVSGSGKSSLVFDTIAAESQRLINETYSTFVQGFMPTLPRPEVDVLDGLTTAIIVDQQRMGADTRSTVGTATDVNAMLRILFSRLGQPHIGSPKAFSFNVPSVSGAGAVSFKRGGQTVKERRSFSITGGMCPR